MRVALTIALLCALSQAIPVVKLVIGDESGPRIHLNAGDVAIRLDDEKVISEQLRKLSIDYNDVRSLLQRSTRIRELREFSTEDVPQKSPAYAYENDQGLEGMEVVPEVNYLDAVIIETVVPSDRFDDVVYVNGIADIRQSSHPRHQRVNRRSRHAKSRRSVREPRVVAQPTRAVLIDDISRLLTQPPLHTQPRVHTQRRIHPQPQVHTQPRQTFTEPLRHDTAWFDSVAEVFLDDDGIDSLPSETIRNAEITRRAASEAIRKARRDAEEAEKSRMMREEVKKLAHDAERKIKKAVEKNYLSDERPLAEVDRAEQRNHDERQPGWIVDGSTEEVVGGQHVEIIGGQPVEMTIIERQPGGDVYAERVIRRGHPVEMEVIGGQDDAREALEPPPTMEEYDNVDATKIDI